MEHLAAAKRAIASSAKDSDRMSNFDSLSCSQAPEATVGPVSLCRQAHYEKIRARVGSKRFTFGVLFLARQHHGSGQFSNAVWVPFKDSEVTSFAVTCRIDAWHLVAFLSGRHAKAARPRLATVQNAVTLLLSLELDRIG